MAQGVVIRFKADSTEYDAKLKRSIEQMKSMEDQAKKLQGSIDRTDEGYVKFVQSLGQMDTVAKSSKTALREYSEAILYLQQQYKALSDAEKSGDIGKAMAESIQQLKVRAAEAQDMIGDLNEELKNLASDTSFTDSIGLMTRTVGSCAAAITAWTGDSKEMEVVIKDLAKIGATVSAVDALTKAFQKKNLVLLKNPYVAATAAAVALGVALAKLYNYLNDATAAQKALDEVQAKGRDDAAKEITRIETLSNILHDNTRSLEDRKTALQEIQALVPDYHGALTTEGTLINDNTDAMTAYVSELQRAATAQAAFDKMVEINKQKLAKQVELKGAQQNYTQKSSTYQEYLNGGTVSGTSSAGVSFDTSLGGTLATEAAVAKKAVDDIQASIDEYDTELQALQGLISAGAIGTSGGGGGASVAGGGGVAASITYASDSIKAQEEKVAELTKLWKEASAELRDGYYAQLQKAKSELEEMKKPLTELKGEMSFAVEPIKVKIDTRGLVTAKKDADSMRASWMAAASAIATVGSALQQVDDPAAKIAGILASAIANIAVGFAAATASPATTAAGVFGWIAAVTTGLATMISTITAIKSVTGSAKGYASGGMVEGTSYSGDNIVARLNAGEGVLTAQGVQNAASMANGLAGAQSGGASSSFVTGENIVLGVNNFLGRSGQGEIVTTSMLRRAGINL